MAEESNLERNLVAWCKTQGILTYKFVSPGAKGVPDRIFIVDGWTIFMELKAPGKKPTKLQMRELERIEAHGAAACWADTLELAQYNLRCYITNPKKDS